MIQPVRLRHSGNCRALFQVDAYSQIAEYALVVGGMFGGPEVHRTACSGCASPGFAGDTGNAPTITRMCKWLGVSKSGLYDWRSRPESAAARRRELLKIKIKALFEANDGTYGYRRLHAALVRGGKQASPELVRQLTRELGLVPCQPAPWRPQTTRQGAAGPIPDLVNGGFSADAPGSGTSRSAGRAG